MKASKGVADLTYPQPVDAVVQWFQRCVKVAA